MVLERSHAYAISKTYNHPIYGRLDFALIYDASDFAKKKKTNCFRVTL